MNLEEMKVYNNMRKHMSQFTEVEKKHLTKRIGKLKNLVLKPHLLERIQEKRIYITHDELAEVLVDFDIIEYRILNMEERAVIRSRTSFYGRNYCLVVSLTKDEIVTIWLNNYHDLHNTLDEELYNKKMKVF